jgi:hypothetical protein
MTSFKEAVKISNEGVLLQLHVVPGSSQSVFPAGYNSWRKCIEIKVQSEAKDNKANIEVRETIASFFQLPVKDVTLISGQRNREKTLSLHHVSRDAVYRKLMETLHGL